MSILATSLTSCASIFEVIMLASSDTVGDAASYIYMYDHLFPPLAHVLPLIMPTVFLLRT